MKTNEFGLNVGYEKVFFISIDCSFGKLYQKYTCCRFLML